MIPRLPPFRGKIWDQRCEGVWIVEQERVRCRCAPRYAHPEVRLKAHDVVVGDGPYQAEKHTEDGRQLIVGELLRGDLAKAMAATGGTAADNHFDPDAEDYAEDDESNQEGRAERPWTPGLLFGGAGMERGIYYRVVGCACHEELVDR